MSTEKAERVAEQQIPQLLGLTPDAPRPGGMLECFNAYVVDQGNAFQTKQTGRYIDQLANIVDNINVDQYGVQMFEYGHTGGKDLIIDNLPFVYMAPMTTTVSGELEIGAWESLGTVSVAGAFSKVVNYAVFEDKCVRVDGLYDNVYFDGTLATPTFVPIGVTTPSGAPTVSSTTGGSLVAGDYEVYYSYVKYAGTANEVLSNPSPVGTVTVSGTAINAAITASADPLVDKIRFYRTLYNAGGVWYRAIADVVNVTGTYKLIASDDTIRGYDTLSFDWVKPPVCDFCVSAANRLWLFDRTTGRAYFSDVGNLEKFSAFNYTSDFDRLDGDEITGVAALKNQIIVFKRNRTYAIDLYGSFAVTVIDSDEGCLNHRTIAVERDAGFIIFLSNGGVKMMSMQGKLDLTINKLWRTDMVFNVQALADPSYCFGSYSKASGCYHLYFSVAGDPSNSVHYVCSLRDSGQQSGAWSKYDHVYSLDPDDNGLKYYSFSVLTDNAGLPFLCGACNALESGNPVRVYQMDGDETLSVPSSPEEILEAPVFSIFDVDPLIFDSGWVNTTRVYACVIGGYMYFVTGVADTVTLYRLDGFGTYTEVASWTDAVSGESVCVNDIRHLGDIVYVNVSIVNQLTGAETIVKKTVNVSTGAVSTYTTIPSGNVQGMILDYRADSRMADYFAFNYSDNDDGEAVLDFTYNGIEYAVLLDGGSNGWDVDPIYDGSGGSYVCMGRHPSALNWIIYAKEDFV